MRTGKQVSATLFFQVGILWYSVWWPPVFSHLLFLSSLPSALSQDVIFLSSGLSAWILTGLFNVIMTSGCHQECLPLVGADACLEWPDRYWHSACWDSPGLGVKDPSSGPALPLAYSTMSWVCICRRQSLTKGPLSSNSLWMCDLQEWSNWVLIVEGAGPATISLHSDSLQETDILW